MGPIRRLIVQAGCLLTLGVTTALGQSGGQLTGVVRDTSGTLLPGVTVTISGASLVTPRTTVTDDQGAYTFDSLPGGRYRVTAAIRGFEPWSMEVQARAGPVRLDVWLVLSPFSEQVTVTATKTGSADVHVIPAAITVLSSKTLEQLGVHTVEGLGGMVPAVTTSQNTGSAQITIRGIGSNNPAAGADQSSSVHVDGVYLGRPSMVFADLLDVERVEVLRGPQGTLYGRNSVGGTINIINRQPTNTLETSGRLTVGNYDRFRIEGAVSGPLVTNRVMGGLTFLRSTRRGFVRDLDHPDHTLGSEDTWAGRGQLRILLGSRSEVRLSTDHARFDGVPLTYAKPIAAKPGFAFDMPVNLWAVRTSHVTSGRNVQQGGLANLTVRLNSTMTLNSLTAYRRMNYRFFIDPDGTELPLQTVEIPDRQRQFSQELTLVGRKPRLTWIAGAFLFDARDGGAAEITVLPAGRQVRPSATVDTAAAALFGHAAYRLSSRVSVTAGVRYTSERKDLENSGGVYRIGTATLAIPNSFYAVTDSATFRAWTPKFSIQAEASPDTFLYVSAAKGFKSGGFNPTVVRPGLAFRPEFAWSYEAGLKQLRADGRFRGNAAFFYTDYRDLQVQSFVRPGMIDISNAAAATIKGFEIDATISAGRGLQLGCHLSWLDAAYDSYLAIAPGGVIEDVAGKGLNNVPEWSGSTSAVYEFAAGRAGSAFVRSDLSWQSRVFFTPFNDMIETQSAYGLVHLRAGIGPRSRRWEVAMFVRNARSREYVTGTANVSLAAYTGRPGEPRHWGTQVTLRRR